MMKLNKNSVSNNSAQQPDKGILADGTDLFMLESGRYYIIEIQSMVNAPAPEDMIGNGILIIDTVLDTTTPIKSLKLQDSDGVIATSIISNGVVTQEWVFLGTNGGSEPPTEKIKSSAFIVGTLDTINVSDDADNPSFFTSFAHLGSDSGDYIIDPVDGSIQNNTGRTIDKLIGGLSFQPFRNGGGFFSSELIYLWSERSTDGINWTQSPLSLRTFEIGNTSETFRTTISALATFLPGEKVRFRFYSTDDNITFESTSTVSNGQTLIGASVAWELQESLSGEIETGSGNGGALEPSTVILAGKDKEFGTEYIDISDGAELIANQYSEVATALGYELDENGNVVGNTGLISSSTLIANDDDRFVYTKAINIGDFIAIDNGLSTINIYDSNYTDFVTLPYSIKHIVAPVQNGFLYVDPLNPEGLIYISFDPNATTPSDVENSLTVEFTDNTFMTDLFGNSFGDIWVNSIHSKDYIYIFGTNKGEAKNGAEYMYYVLKQDLVDNSSSATFTEVNHLSIHSSSSIVSDPELLTFYACDNNGNIVAFSENSDSIEFFNCLTSSVNKKIVKSEYSQVASAGIIPCYASNGESYLIFNYKSSFIIYKMNGDLEYSKDENYGCAYYVPDTGIKMVSNTFNFYSYTDCDKYIDIDGNIISDLSNIITDLPSSSIRFTGNNAAYQPSYNSRFFNMSQNTDKFIHSSNAFTIKIVNVDKPLSLTFDIDALPPINNQLSYFMFIGEPTPFIPPSGL